MVRLLLLVLVTAVSSGVGANTTREVRIACAKAERDAQQHLAKATAYLWALRDQGVITYEQLAEVQLRNYNTQDNVIRIGRASRVGTAAECEGEAEIMKSIIDNNMKEFTK